MRGAQKNQGITVIELLLVIIVASMLAVLVYLTFNGAQAKNRNAERRQDVDALKSQLETYYANANTYPTVSNINDPVWRAQNIKRLPTDSIKDPGWDKNNNLCTNDNHRPQFAAKPTNNCYSYQVSSADGSPCDNSATPCAHYTLTTILEGGENYTKTSLN